MHGNPHRLLFVDTAVHLRSRVRANRSAGTPAWGERVLRQLHGRPVGRWHVPRLRPWQLGCVPDRLHLLTTMRRRGGPDDGVLWRLRQ